MSGVFHRWLAGGCAAGLAGLLAGCASMHDVSHPRTAPALSMAAPPVAQTADSSGPLADSQSDRDDVASLIPAEPITVALPPQPLAQLINAVFGDILKVPYAVGPDVASRGDVVAMRGVTGMSKRDFFRLVQVALKNYGVRVYIHDHVVNVVSDTTLTTWSWM